MRNLGDRRYDLYHIEWDRAVGRGNAAAKRERARQAAPAGPQGGGGG